MATVTGATSTPRRSSGAACPPRCTPGLTFPPSCTSGKNTSSTRSAASVARPEPEAGSVSSSVIDLDASDELVAELAAVDGDGPAGEVDVQRLVDVDLQLAAVEPDGERGVAA